VHVICMASCKYSYIYGTYICFVGAYSESMLSLVSSWTQVVKLQQPYLPQAAGSGLTSPNIIPFILVFKVGSG